MHQQTPWFCPFSQGLHIFLFCPTLLAIGARATSQMRPSQLDTTDEPIKIFLLMGQSVRIMAGLLWFRLLQHVTTQKQNNY